MDSDTIVAIATPPGRGGIGIVRISGPATRQIAAALLGVVPPERAATLRAFRDGDGGAIDRGVALFFPGPHSFTGEDVLELQGHGGPVVLDLIVERVLGLGARLARPGEFSERAFLNGRLDLAQAEAIADLIDSATRASARAAMRSLSGEFSAAVEAVVEDLTTLRVYVEADIDFPDEEVDVLADGGVAIRLEAIADSIASLIAGARRGRLLRDGLTVVIAGRPNAGKSSLLNRFAGYEAAIVTEVPGTTRDLLNERIDLDGLPLTVCDTAGLRPGGDLVEQEGMRRARARLAEADLVLLIVDDQVGFCDEDAAIIAELPNSMPACRIYNKVDLTGRTPGLDDSAIALSAATGAGFDALVTFIKASAGFDGGGENFLARRRHLDALARAAERIEAARRHCAVRRGELIAEELRLAQQDLGAITGTVTSDELLGRIFSNFCIGK